MGRLELADIAWDVSELEGPENLGGSQLFVDSVWRWNDGGYEGNQKMGRAVARNGFR